VAGDRIDEFTEQTFHRVGIDSLPAHLEGQYGIAVTGLTELDVGVLRVDRSDGPSWVARVFPAARPVECAEGDAAILGYLEQLDFPAERCPAAPAVTVHERQAVLVTEFLPGLKAGSSRRTCGQLGDLLGRLHTLPRHTLPPPALRASPSPVTDATARPGGAWHHLAFEGGPRAELDAALALLDAASDRVPAGQSQLFAQLRAEIERTDDGHGLPEALIHPDFVPANAITTTVREHSDEGSGRRGARADGGLTLVDWAGAGLGPRLWSLAFLLWASGGRALTGVDAAVDGYLRHVNPEPPELSRLGAVILARPLVFSCWAFCLGRRELPAIVAELPALRDHANAIAARATQAFSPTSAPRTAPSPREASGPGEPDMSAGVAATAVTVAAVRAAETDRPDRLFADPLAAAFVAASGWTPTAPPGDRRAAIVRVWVTARTVFLDELLVSASKDGCLQVVLLGAGLDARAFRLPWPAGLRCFELDTGDVLAYKARVIGEQVARPGCERIPVVADLREDWPGALLNAGFTPGQPTAWIAEGLLVYLEPDDVEGVVADLTALSAPGSRLGLTMSSAPPTSNSGAQALWRSTAPSDPASWLSGHGWAAQVTNAFEVLAAHGRPIQAKPTPERVNRALLIDAARADRPAPPRAD
jgi:methyltransferase (TIGR00027 family)